METEAEVPSDPLDWLSELEEGELIFEEEEEDSKPAAKVSLDYNIQTCLIFKDTNSLKVKGTVSPNMLKCEVIVSVKCYTVEVNKFYFKNIIALLDTGCSKTLLIKSSLPPNFYKNTKNLLEKSNSWNTGNGHFLTGQVLMADFRLPEFNVNRDISYEVALDDRHSSFIRTYDMIIGRDLLADLGVIIDFQNYIIDWAGTRKNMLLNIESSYTTPKKIEFRQNNKNHMFKNNEFSYANIKLNDPRQNTKKGMSVHIHNKPSFENPKTNKNLKNTHVDFPDKTKAILPSVTNKNNLISESRNTLIQELLQLNNESYIVQHAEKRATEILDAHYEKADLNKIVLEIPGLQKCKKRPLLGLLHEYSDLFDGTLGDFQGSPVTIELKKDAKPYCASPFQIPLIHENLMKKEVKRLVSLGVLEGPLDHLPEWGAPCFPIPKKNGQIRFISDFRRLNTMIKRSPCPTMTSVQNILRSLNGFSYATSLDLNSGYYTIRLSPEASNICTITLPWGSYKYKRLPMGLASAADHFQQKMSRLM